MTDSEGKQTNMTSTESNGIYVDSQDQETNTADAEGVREISLTDHLNKRLLDSFLQRLNENQPDASVSSATDNTEFEDDKPQID